MPQVAIVEVGETRVLADRTALDARADDKHATARAMVCPLAAVLLDAATKLGKGHQQHAPGRPPIAAIAEQVLACSGNLLQQAFVRRELFRMRVETINGQVEGPGPEPLLDQTGDEVHFP